MLHEIEMERPGCKVVASVEAGGERPDEPKAKKRNEPNLILCFQQNAMRIGQLGSLGALLPRGTSRTLRSAARAENLEMRKA
jgi:hypothetical protein